MVSIYVIKNRDKNTQVELNELILLNTIKSLRHRNKDLCKIWIEKLETLEKKNFSDEALEY